MPDNRLERIRQAYCNCCECQGKKCLIPHPGHSHRYPFPTAEELKRAERRLPDSECEWCLAIYDLAQKLRDCREDKDAK